MKPSFVIVGLGNPGASYERTRHNVGFQAVDVLSKEYGEGEWREVQKFNASVQEGNVERVRILLVKPHTYMNRSGEAIHKIMEFYKLSPQTQLLVICDDIDLPAGAVRLRMKGGPGTHNGLRSIMATYGENYPRLRIGLGVPVDGSDLAGWVLSVPSSEDQALLTKAYDELPYLVRTIILQTKKDAAKT